MGADLSDSCVKDDSIACPFHGWVYGKDGVCKEIPAQQEIPQWARIKSYPATERFGQVYFYYGLSPAPEFPFFDIESQKNYIYSSSFTLETGCPWYLIGANGCDIQHFKMSHDRRIISEPEFYNESDEIKVTRLHLYVNKGSIRDNFLRLVAGDKFTFTVKSWRGTLVFAEARFRNTSTRGVVSIVPTGRRSAQVRETVILPVLSDSGLWKIFSYISLYIRRYYVKEFLKSDVSRINGVRYDPERTLPVDCYVKEYIEWVSGFRNDFHEKIMGSIKSSC
jgi:phenylpropionate dioxygenase-like ring-hydroxylating dioxygenase large terminal subunit